MAAFRPKTFLLVLEINDLLLHLNNPRQKVVGSPSSSRLPVYTDTYDGLNVAYRQGKNQLLSNLFINLKEEVDVAVWSNLSNQYTNDLCHQYFTRYYRNLLFILATNRALYGDHPQHASIKVRKELQAVYNRFHGYNSTNTIVVTAHPNLMDKHARNDLIVPEFTPENPQFDTDPGLLPLSKYIQGLVMVKRESGIGDITRFINAKEAKNIFKRAAHNRSTHRQFL